MTFKDKIILMILTILTLGIYPMVIFSNKKQKVNTQLKSNNRININIKLLKEYLGNEENIAGSEYTQKKVKIFFKDKSKILINELEKLKGISGVFLSSKYVTIIVGNSAKIIANSL